MATIDALAQSPDGTAVALILAAQRYEGTGEELVVLQQRLNDYLSMCLDGRLDDAYPELVDLEKVIQVDYSGTMPDQTADFLNAARPAIEDSGLPLRWCVSTTRPPLRTSTTLPR